MKTMFPLSALFASALLGACTANSYCIGSQPYQKAPSVAALKTADGLQLPDSASALRIPPAPAKAVPYGQTVKDADGDDVVVCLDKPPEMPSPAQPPKVEPPKAEAPKAEPPKTEPAAAPKTGEPPAPPH